jgi:hypothetical protein
MQFFGIVAGRLKIYEFEALAGVSRPKGAPKPAAEIPSAAKGSQSADAVRGSFQ